MSNKEFLVLEDTNDLLKIDKDLINVQKTIIYYGEKILHELENIKVLIKENNKNIRCLEKENTKPQDPLIQQLIKMKIPKGYKQL